MVISCCGLIIDCHLCYLYAGLRCWHGWPMSVLSTLVKSGLRSAVPAQRGAVGRPANLLGPHSALLGGLPARISRSWPGSFGGGVSELLGGDGQQAEDQAL